VEIGIYYLRTKKKNSRTRVIQALKETASKLWLCIYRGFTTTLETVYSTIFTKSRKSTGVNKLRDWKSEKEVE